MTTLIPRHILFGNPEKMAPQISPDGKKLAYLAPYKNVMNIWVGNPDSNYFRPVTQNIQRGIFSYFWGQDNQQILYLQDNNGDENWHLFSVNTLTGEFDDLTPFDGVQTKIAEHDKHFPNDVILAMNFDNPNFYDLFHLDLKTHQLSKIAENPGNFVGWQLDTRLKVRGAFIANERGGYDLLVRKTESSEWYRLISWDYEDSQNIAVETFTQDGRFIILRDSRDLNTTSLVKVNIDTGAREIIFSDPHYDLNFVMTHPETYEVQLLSVARARNEIIVFDPDIEADVNNIDGLNNGDFVIYDRDNSDQQWIVAFTEDNGPASFYLYDRNRKKGHFLFHNQPELRNYHLAEMRPFECQSRDGLTLHGYISFPPGRDRKNLPMVLNVHGGPWQRDTWGYNPEVQWLTNRGYICLQVNYRGSVGYGKDFLNAGNKEWGGKMHEDLLAAVKWSIEQGYADPERVAVYGISYGGYASLVSAVFTPAYFTCAIDVVGPTNLITLIENIPSYWQAHLHNLKRRIGDPETETEFLKSRSPLFHIENVGIPLLIAHGGNDPRVKKSESEAIVTALKANNLYFEYIMFPDEGHGIVKPDNRLTFYAIAERFLARYLGGDSEEIADLNVQPV